MAKTFIIQDAAMNDLIRPTLYDAWHESCRSSNRRRPRVRDGRYRGAGLRIRRLSRARTDTLPPLEAGRSDRHHDGGRLWRGAVRELIIRGLLVAEVLVKGGRLAIVRPRQTYEELIGRDRLAAWQS